MHVLLDAIVKELPKLGTSLILLALAWLVGYRLTASWNVRQKRRELDLVTARDFHALYGEFFAVWKLWNYAYHDKSLDTWSRWELLKRSCEAEAKLETMLVRLACDRALGKSEYAILGAFRQLYQQLRESIGRNIPLQWTSSSHPSYIEFKRLAPEIACLITIGQAGTSIAKNGGFSLIEITSNKWETTTGPDKESERST